MPGLAFARATNSSRLLALRFAFTARYSGATPSNETGTKSFSASNAGFALTNFCIANIGPSVIMNV
ncbi:hypothetical protein D3C71_2038010 [compost metagenome]